MRLRTLIELLAALILTFAALFAVSKMARTTGLKVDNAYARATIVESKTGAVYMTLNDAGSELNGLGCTATNIARCAAGFDSPYSDMTDPLELSQYSE
jgi:copper(I)-binding protein